MLRLIRDELLKTFLKKRTYIGFGIILLIVPLVEIAMNLEGSHFIAAITRTLARDFFFSGNLFNGWFIAYQIMNSLWLQIPILISFVVGDQLAGEATAGTYRLILIRPVSRTKIFFAKYAASIIYTILFVAFLGGLSVGLALFLAGRGDLLVYKSEILLLTDKDVAWRFLVGYMFAFWTMTTIASISFFFSSFVDNAIGPIVGTMGVYFICSIITLMPIQLFDAVRPHLFTSYLDLWSRVFAEPIDWGKIRIGALYLGGYSFASVAGAWYIFIRKDILS